MIERSRPTMMPGKEPTSRRASGVVCDNVYWNHAIEKPLHCRSFGVRPWSLCLSWGMM